MTVFLFEREFPKVVLRALDKFGVGFCGQILGAKANTDIGPVPTSTSLQTR